MEGVFLLDSNSDVVFQEKMATESTGNSGRKKLADISNMPRKPSTLSQDNKPRPNSATVKEYIEQLQKENAALMKLVADKNRIIELSGAELHKLRITLQKMQQQNLQLAQSNSQMLAELNSGKDRLKDLQHQLGCKNGLLIAKKMELEGKWKTKTCQTNDPKRMNVSEHEEPGVCIVAERDKDKQCNAGGRQKSKSLGPSVRKDQDKGVGDNGRIRARRQSARFKHDEPKSTKDLFHTDNVDLPPCPLLDDTMQEDDSHLVKVSVKKEDVEGDSVSLERRRSSISRPSREAAKKVQSYKEMNVKVKLRRTE
ncbi:SHUGOSHIN 1-like isoform X2 [Cynara cardunculus var. scolymus]|uniref:SHUGOSHIN 1-like isoform X2 n=1 Tax=Cynara cardunculus var. scolymus TaxID=59895 RepID=UPI000D62ED13|nr:SHUGOSHIN 1-like isoform X2 [Cynara cardunculus var. scolymus]